MGSKAEGNQVHVSKVFRILILGININHILVASLLKICLQKNDENTVKIIFVM